MTDRELLELAAKAARIEITPHSNSKLFSDLVFVSGGRNWNPLRDDGDALRLAVKLNLSVRFDACSGGVEINAYGEWDDAPDGAQEIYESGSDSYAATRRAIVIAAASIGETL